MVLSSAKGIEDIEISPLNVSSRIRRKQVDAAALVDT